MYLISEHPAMLNAWGFVCMLSSRFKVNSWPWQLRQRPSRSKVHSTLQRFMSCSFIFHTSPHVANFGNVKDFDIPIIASYKQIALICFDSESTCDSARAQLTHGDPRRTSWHAAGKTSAGPRSWTFVFHLIHTSYSFADGCVWKWLVPLNPMVNDH